MRNLLEDGRQNTSLQAEALHQHIVEFFRPAEVIEAAAAGTVGQVLALRVELGQALGELGGGDGEAVRRAGGAVLGSDMNGGWAGRRRGRWWRSGVRAIGCWA